MGVVALRGTEKTSLTNWIQNFDFELVDCNDAFPNWEAPIGADAFEKPVEEVVWDIMYERPVELRPDIIKEGCKVTRGFALNYMSLFAADAGAGMFAEIIDTLKSRRDAAALYTTGHSLGGALVSMFLLHLLGCKTPDCSEALAKISEIHAYTYGQPRVGNDNFALTLEYALRKANADTAGAALYRITQWRDPVQYGPPRFKGFAHAGYEVYYTLHGGDAKAKYYAQNPWGIGYPPNTTEHRDDFKHPCNEDNKCPASCLLPGNFGMSEGRACGSAATDSFGGGRTYGPTLLNAISDHMEYMCNEKCRDE